MNEQQILEIDSKLTDISKNWSLLSLLKPVNTNDEQEAFYMGHNIEPQFTYSEFKENPFDFFKFKK